MIIEVENGFLVKVPEDIKKPTISNWNDGTTTLEFYSETYVMEYDSFEIGVPEEKQMKEITLPKQGQFKINKKIPKKLSHLIDGGKWFLLTKTTMDKKSKIPTEYFTTEEMHTGITVDYGSSDDVLPCKLVILHQCGNNKKELISQLKTYINGLETNFEDWGK
jgi:hypothetical protein